jgi:hypothetical protein
LSYLASNGGGCDNAPPSQYPKYKLYPARPHP